MKKKEILLVDDDAQIVEVVGERLRFEGFTVSTAYTVEGGLRQLKKKKPDLIILDIGLPGMNGITFLNQIASNAAKRPRIVVFTARTHNLEEFTGHPAVDAAVTKTSGPDELLREIRRLLGTTAPSDSPSTRA